MVTLELCVNSSCHRFFAFAQHYVIILRTMFFFRSQHNYLWVFVRCWKIYRLPLIFFLTGCGCQSSEMSSIWIAGITCTVLSHTRWCGTKPQHLQSRVFSPEALGCYCDVMFSVSNNKRDLRPRSSSAQTVVRKISPPDCLKRAQVTLPTFQNVEGGLSK